EPAGPDTRDVEQALEENPDLFRTAAHGADIAREGVASLVRIAKPALDQLEAREDRRERRTKLVGGNRDELLAQREGLADRPFLRGNVARDRRRTDHPPVRVVDGRDRDRHPKTPAV